MLELLRNAGGLQNSLRYDYSEIEPQHRETVQDAAIDIRQRGQRATADMIAIGHQLSNVKDLIPHGQFVNWLETEFSLSLRTAQNFMAVANRFGDKNATVAFLSDSVLYMLSGPRVPEDAVGAVLAEAEANGKSPTKKRTREILDQYIPRTGPTAPEDTDDEFGPHLYQVANYNTLDPKPCTIIYNGIKPADGQFVVYGLVDPRNDKTYYIGSTDRFDARMKDHCQMRGSKILRQRTSEIFAAGLHTTARVLAQAGDRTICEQIEMLLIQQDMGLLNRKQDIHASPLPVLADYQEPRYLDESETEAAIWVAIRKQRCRLGTDMLVWMARATLLDYQRALNPGFMLDEEILTRALATVRGQIQPMAERETPPPPAKPAKTVYVAPEPPPPPQAAVSGEIVEDDEECVIEEQPPSANRNARLRYILAAYKEALRLVPEYGVLTGQSVQGLRIGRTLEDAIRNLQGNLVE